MKKLPKHKTKYAREMLPKECGTQGEMQCIRIANCWCLNCIHVSHRGKMRILSHGCCSGSSASKDKYLKIAIEMEERTQSRAAPETANS